MTKAEPQRPIDSLDMSVRLSNILHVAATQPRDYIVRRGVPLPRTLGDLAQWTLADVRALPNMGKRTMRELEQLLASHGYALRVPAIKTCRAAHCENVVAKMGDLCATHRCGQPGCVRRKRKAGLCAQHQPGAPVLAKKPPRAARPGTAAQGAGAFRDLVRASSPPLFTADLDAVDDIARMLRPLPKDMQLRVLDAVCMLLGHPAEIG